MQPICFADYNTERHAFSLTRRLSQSLTRATNNAVFVDDYGCGITQLQPEEEREQKSNLCSFCSAEFLCVSVSFLCFRLDLHTEANSLSIVIFVYILFSLKQSESS